MSLIALACLIAAPALLIILSAIDLKHYLLPDKLVALLLILGIVFHITTSFYYVTIFEIFTGPLIGGGLLYAVRTAANRYYKQDTLGLGDVKLLIAAGVWLGPQDVLLAVIAGAMAGIGHGIFIALYRRHKTGQPVNIARLNLPAGPGFAIGIAIAGFIKFSSFFDLFF